VRNGDRRRGRGGGGRQTTFLQDGRLPIPSEGVSSSRIIQGQLPKEGGLGLGEEGSEHRPPLPPGHDHPPAFPKEPSPWFAYLPPLNVQLWERDWYRTYIAGTAGVANTITEERVPNGRVLVITNYRFYATKVQAGANPVLMDDGELVDRVTFNLALQGGAGYSAGTLSGAAPTVTGRTAGVSLLNRNRDDFSPGFALYADGGTLVTAQYTRNTTPTVNPDNVGAIVTGYLMSAADFRRSLPAGAHF